MPTVAKLTERVVCNQLIRYILSHNILSDHQHGFRPGHSTETAMLDAVSFIVRSLDTKKVTGLTTVDTSKAFDSVPHRLLLEKLVWYGIDVHWFQNWLSGRSQRIGNGSSAPVTHGVVQGSLIGPVLYLQFTNDFASYVSDAEIIMYADDVQFMHSDRPGDIDTLKLRMLNTLNEAHSWFVENSLKINPKKTEVMLFRTRQRHISDEFSINFNGTVLCSTSSAKVLGVVIDENLTWEAQVSLVVKRCYATLYGLSKFCCGLSMEVKKMLIEALIFPHILYCLTVWGGCCATQRHRIQKVINHCARIIFCSRKSDHVTPLLNRLEWPSVEESIGKRDVFFISRTLYHPFAPRRLRDCIVHRSRVSNRNTRATSAGLLQLPRVHTELAKRFYSYRAAALWNQGRG